MSNRDAKINNDNETSKDYNANVSYNWKSSEENPNYSTPFPVPFRVYLIYNKSDRIYSIPVAYFTNLTEGVFDLNKSGKTYRVPAQVIRNLIASGKLKKDLFKFIESTPKYLITLVKSTVKYKSVGAAGTIELENYQTDDFKVAQGRLLRAVSKFCDKWEPLYRLHKVSMLFHTFTMANFSNKGILGMVDLVKKRYNRLGIEIKAYIWVLEIKENKNMRYGFNIHYHLVIVIDRVKWNKIPEQLKFDLSWGKLTNVGFIKKSIKNYLSPYLKKSKYRLKGARSYGVNMK